jgi:hypothetical protein
MSVLGLSPTPAPRRRRHRTRLDRRHRDVGNGTFPRLGRDSVVLELTLRRHSLPYIGAPSR